MTQVQRNAQLVDNLANMLSERDKTIIELKKEIESLKQQLELK